MFCILWSWSASLEIDRDDKITIKEIVSIIPYIAGSPKDDDEPAFTWYATKIARIISFSDTLLIIGNTDRIATYNQIWWKLPFPGKYIVSSFIEYSVPGIVSRHPNTVSGRKSSSDNVLKTDTSNNPLSLFFDIVVVCPLRSPELIVFEHEI